MKNLVETLELPKDLVYKAAIVTIIGQKEVLIENYKGILEYEPSHIKIQTKGSRMSIYGKELIIAYYTNEEMKVTGYIQSVEYEANI